MLAVTPGEPAGIGPDLIIALAQGERSADWVVLADADMLLARARALGLPCKLKDAPSRRAGCLYIEPVPLAAPAAPGKLNVANAAGVVAALERAVDGCPQRPFSSVGHRPGAKVRCQRGGHRFFRTHGVSARPLRRRRRADAAARGATCESA